MTEATEKDWQEAASVLRVTEQQAREKLRRATLDELVAAKEAEAETPSED